MNRIKFSYMWDKLNDPEFTTIRSWTEEKESYYRDLIGQKFQVWKTHETYPYELDHKLFVAWLLSLHVDEPDNIDRSFLSYDVTINGHVWDSWYDKILKMNRVIVLSFSKAEPKQKIPVNTEEWE